MMEEKYVVFKSEDWSRYVEMDLSPDKPTPRFPNQIYDAIVIRRQDIFAAPALFEYAGQIRSCMEILQELEQPVPDQLEGIANYFSEQAELAMKTKSKLPD